MYFLSKVDFFKIKNTSNLGKEKIEILLREYLTKLSVKIDIDKTSKNLEIEYINGIKD